MNRGKGCLTENPRPLDLSLSKKKPKTDKQLVVGLGRQSDIKGPRRQGKIKEDKEGKV